MGGPLLVDAGDRSVALGAAFVAGFYLTLVGTKVAMAGLVETGRRRGRGRRLPRVVSARLGTPGVVARFGRARFASAAVLAVAAIALLADGAARLAG